MTREECLEYRRECPYDAMGDYSVLIGQDSREAEKNDDCCQTEAPADK